MDRTKDEITEEVLNLRFNKGYEQGKKDEIARQIDADIEEMDSWEKKCALWMLLRWYDANEMEVPMEPDTVKEYKEYVFMRDVKVTINHLIELLGFDIWR